MMLPCFREAIRNPTQPHIKGTTPDPGGPEQ